MLRLEIIAVYSKIHAKHVNNAVDKVTVGFKGEHLLVW